MRSIQPLYQHLFRLLGAAVLAALSERAGATGAPPQSSVPQYTFTLKSSAVSCPTLLATSGIQTIPVTTTSSGVPHFTAYAHFDSAQVVPQFSVPNGTATPIIYKASNSSQIVVFLAKGQRAIIDNDGASICLPLRIISPALVTSLTQNQRFFDAGCTQELSLPIKNLTHVLSSNQPSQVNIIARPREQSKEEDLLMHLRTVANLTQDITIYMYNQCGKPVKNHIVYLECLLQNPILLDSLYPSALHELPMNDDGNGEFTDTCTYFDQKARKDECLAAVQKVLNAPNAPFLNKLPSLPKGLKYLQTIINNAQIRKAIEGALETLAVPEIALALRVLGNYDTFVSKGGVGPLSELICTAAVAEAMQIAARLDTEQAFTVPILNGQFSLPFTAVTASRTVSIASVTCSSATSSASACGNPGTCGNYPLCNAAQACYCAPDAEGGAGCFQYAPCASLKACTTSADCGAGYACLNKDNCCGFSGCVAASVCTNSRAVFGKMAERPGFAKSNGDLGWTGKGL